MPTEMSNSFIESLKTEKEDLRDLNMEMGEIILDNLLKDDFLEKIPIFKYVYSSYKFTLGIKEGLLLRKIARFLFDVGEIPVRDREKFILEYETNPAFQSKVVEKTLIILDKIDELNKVNILANLFKSLVAGKIGIDNYARLIHIVQQIYLDDLIELSEMYQKSLNISQEKGSMFAGLGLINIRFEINVEGDLILHYEFSQFSVDLFAHGFA